MSTLGAVTYKNAQSVTTSNTGTDPNGPFDALEATTASGATKVTCCDGTVVTIYLAQGVIKPLCVSLVWTTGTSATGIIGYKGAAGSPAAGIHP